MKIGHVWFDFSETIGHINKEQHDKIKYAVYAAVVGKSIDDELRHEFEAVYKEHHNSISDIFYSLGKPAGWWSSQLATVEPSKLFKLAESDIPQILKKLREIVPISIFSNIDLDLVLPALGIDTKLFKYILSSGMVSKPKPALDGFYEIIELSNLQPDQILYVGDHVMKDILPAKKVGLQAGIIWSKSNEADYSFNSFSEVLTLIEGQR